MNLVSFPFYPTLSQQARYGRCGENVGALYSPTNRFLPFMLRQPKTGAALSEFVVFNAQDNSVVLDIKNSVTYEKYQDRLNDYLFYYGSVIPNFILPCGIYYLKVDGWYSEVFTVTNKIPQLLKLEWKHTGGRVEELIYQTGLTNVLYLDSVIAAPVYNIDEEGEEDTFGAFEASRIKNIKTYNFDTEFIPEFLVDALANMALHNEIRIGPYENVRSVKIETKGNWDNTDCNCSVNITFAAENPALSDCCSGLLDLTKLDLNYVDTGNPKRCQTGPGGTNTGYLEREQRNSQPPFDIRWVRDDYNTTQCPLPAVTYRSVLIRELVYRDNCASGESPQGVFYEVAEGYSVSMVSQQAADTAARTHFNNTKQAYANANDVCTTNPVIFICERDPGGCWTGTITDADGSPIVPTAEMCISCNQSNPPQPPGQMCITPACN